ncbi:MAG: amidohydrolase family protein [Planctomycetota bacterium]|nr:amidohydrolase family protein [Planctomycetota bacterium]
MAGMKQWSVSADWIVPVDGPPIVNGVMRGRGKLIEAIGAPREVAHSANHKVFRKATIIPGLVNAHAHLEQSHLAGQLPPNRPFLDWLEAQRAKPLAGKDQDTVVAQGAAGALATGTTALADVSWNHRAWLTLRNSPLRKVCMNEVQDLFDPPSDLDGMVKKLRGAPPADVGIRYGLMLQSPWTASPALCKEAVSLAGRRNWIIGMHLAETEAERQYMLHRLGQLIEYRRRQGASEPADDTFRGTPIAYARSIGLLDIPALLVHLSRIDDEDVHQLSQGRATVVYCPRANKFWGRGAHRYADMIAAGVNVALGTETLAANANMDMIDEMRQLRFEGKVDVNTILRAATLNGAKAFGWDDRIGTLTPGKQADWVAVQLGPNPGNPIESMLTMGGKVLETAIAGETVYRSPDLKNPSPDEP